MKKIAVLLILFITTYLIGCDFLSNTDPEPTNSTTNSTEGVTLETNPYINSDPNTDDVEFDILFDDSIYKKFTIYFSEDNFIKLIDDMENYNDQWGNYRDNTIQEVDILYEDGEGNIMELNEVGFRTKGNIFSRVLPAIVEEGEIQYFQQTSFQLEFNETFNYVENSTEYKFLKSREYFDLEQLNFKHIRSGDFAVVTESIAYDMFRDAGVITANTSYAIIYFDIEGLVVPYGIFMLQEPMDDVFAERYFGKNDDSSIGDIYKCTWQDKGPATLEDNYNNSALGVSDYNEGYRRTYAKKTNKINDDFTSFTDFIDVANTSLLGDYYNTISNYLMVDNFAKASALHFLIGSPDDYRSNANNYYMFFNEGEAYYIPFDFDNALGYGWNPYEDFGLDLSIDTVNTSNGIDPSSLVIIYNLLETETFRDMYNGYLDIYTQSNGIFNYQKAVTEYNLVYNLYYSEITSNKDFLGLTYFDIESRWETNLSLEYYMESKITEVRVQLSNAGIVWD